MEDLICPGEKSTVLFFGITLVPKENYSTPLLLISWVLWRISILVCASHTRSARGRSLKRNRTLLLYRLFRQQCKHRTRPESPQTRESNPAPLLWRLFFFTQPRSNSLNGSELNTTGASYSNDAKTHLKQPTVQPTQQIVWLPKCYLEVYTPPRVRRECPQQKERRPA